MDNSISITLGTPKHGWLPVVFRHKDFEIEFNASNVLNDPVDELIYATTKLQANETKRITFWLEAPAYYFDVTKSSNNFSLTISYSDDFFDKATETKVLRIIKGNKYEIMEPFQSALKQFERLPYDKQHWCGFNEEE